MVKMMSAAVFQVSGPNERVRVRVPGKYIVLGSILVAGLFMSSLSYLQSTTQPSPFAQRSFVEGDVNYLALEPFLVDLSPDSNGRTTYLRLSATLVLSNARGAEKVEAASPLLRERISFFLRELRPEDLAGTERMEQVKIELARRVNLFAGDDVVKDVAISEIVIQ